MITTSEISPISRATTNTTSVLQIVPSPKIVQIVNDATNVSISSESQPNLTTDIDEYLTQIPEDRRAYFYNFYVYNLMISGLKHRLDYVLPQYRTEVNALSALSAHFM